LLQAPEGSFGYLFALSAKEVWRNRFALALIFVIPAVFLAVTSWTSGNLPLPIKLFYGDSTGRLFVPQRQLLFVYVCASTGGFLVAFFATVIFLENAASYRMAFVMGLSWRRFLAARLAFLVCLVAALSLYLLAILAGFATVKLALAVLAGYFLFGAVYGTCGCIVGCLARNFYAGILCIFFLANIDASWLQNPVYFASAQETRAIRYLPAYAPIQVVLAGAFGGRVNVHAVLLSLAYAGGLLVLFFVVFRVRFGRYLSLDRRPQ
jgi:hypothetical protein